jgi:outer membrane protein
MPRSHLSGWKLSRRESLVIQPLTTGIRFVILLILLLGPVAAKAEELLTTSPAPTNVNSSLALSIQDAIALALSNNLNVAIEQINPDIADTNVKIADGSYDPTARADIEYRERSSPRSAEQQAADGRASTESRNTRASVGLNQKTPIGTDIGITANTSNSENTFNSFRNEFTSFSGVTLTQPLLKNAGTQVNLADRRIAIKGVQSANATFYYNVEGIILDVLKTYYELLFSVADADSRRSSLVLAEQLVVDNQTRLDLGTATPLDVSQAQSEAATRFGQVLDADLAIYQNANLLKRLISRDISSLLQTQLRLVDAMPNPASAPDPIYSAATGLENRRDYRSQLALAEQDKIRLAYDKNQLLPTIDLRGSFGFNGLDSSFSRSFNRVVDTRDEDWIVGLAVEIPLGSTSERARRDASQLRKEQRLLQIKDLEQRIIVEVDNAARSVQISKQKYDTNRSARVFSEKVAQAEAEKLKAGISTSYTVLQLQRDAAEARTQELRAMVNYQNALADLLRAQGTLLAEYKVDLPGQTSTVLQPKVTR